MPKRTHKDLSQLTQTVETQATSLLEPVQEQATTHRATRLVYIPLGQVVPDRFQSRVILPPDIKGAFFAGEMDCYQAAHALLGAADGDAGLRREVDELLLLGQSILSEGQVEPATGSWVQVQGLGPRFFLEAGERRFWSLVLNTVQQQLQEEPRLQVVEQKETSRLRQVAENIQREDISAVDLAKAIASLILLFQEKYPDPNAANEMDYYRQALDGRLPHGIWPELERIVGFARPHLVRHLQILNLSDELLYLASLYRVEERRLRVIVAAPKQQQRELLLAAIEEQLSSEDLERAVEVKKVKGKNTRHRAVPVVYRQMASRVKSLLKFTQQSDFDRNYDRVATELSTLMKDPDDLEQAARQLESLASSLRKIRGRRR
jgi:ParB-like chromosome segregation protein Spo0J